MLGRRYLDIDVLTAARQRIAWVFDRGEPVSVSFSGGKDSTVLLHLVMEEAIRRDRRVTVVFLDWEAQYKLTIECVRECFELYADHIDPLWIALPMRTTNACSQIEPEWVCWDPDVRDRWVRQPPPEALTDPAALPFYRDRMTFEDLVPALGAHLEGCTFVGIRTRESLNRWRTIASTTKARVDGQPWTTAWEGHWSAYPLYDWRAEDVWTFLGRSGLPYNRVYDRMHQAGISLHQMRICEPYGDEQRRGLWLYHVLEPETWPRVVSRVAGANTGALYARERGNVMGNSALRLPPGHTWQSFSALLLDTMPAPTAEHYRNKIAVYIRWWTTKGGLEALPDEQPRDTGARDVPSWRRVCKMLLKNDYWAKTLCFSPTKTAAYGRYQEMMRKRREKWGIYADAE